MSTLSMDAISSESPSRPRGREPHRRPRAIALIGVGALVLGFGCMENRWGEDAADRHMEPKAAGSCRLWLGESLSAGERLTSDNGRFALVYQDDGNLVLYETDGVPLWDTHTWGTDPGVVAMQSDGNLVVYDGAGTPLWDSGTWGHEVEGLVLQDDGNLVIYDVAGAAVWASGTVGHGAAESDAEPAVDAGEEDGLRNERYGINTHRPRGDWAAQLYDAVRDAGITWVRIDIEWDEIELERGVFDWDKADQPIRAARERGLHVFASLTDTPSWANGGRPSNVPPDDPDDWTNFCREVATRYDGAHGEPRVDVFGLWNEPDGMGLSDDYSSSERVDAYVESILIPGYEGIHAARTDAYVAGPDLASDRDFLIEMLDRAASAVDIITVHRYSDFADGVTDSLEDTRSILEDAGVFGSKPLWLTETGWSTHSGCWNETENDETQAERYVELLDRLADRPWVEKVFFYELVDDDSPGACPWGVLNGDGSEKPAYRAYRDFIADHDPGHDAAPTPAPGSSGSGDSGSGGSGSGAPGSGSDSGSGSSGPGSGGGPATGDMLLRGQELHAGESRVSTDGRFLLVYQGDGNLVLYVIASGEALWSSGTWGTETGVAVMQGDGNFVVYDASGTPRWDSVTGGSEGDRVVVQNDGNLVLYTASGAALWASRTCCR
jgi:aryl-phospho-beta-D-glucosidase BglC (GH1 family)